MHKKITIDSLKVGMFVVEAGEGTFESPTSKLNKLIRDDLEIVILQKTGVQSVLVDMDKSVSSGSPEPQVCTFADDIGEIDAKMSKAVAYSRSMMEDVRMGRSVDPKQARQVVDSILENIFQNESAALFLIKLGNYDNYTYMHCVNVSVLATVFGHHLGLDKKELYDLGLSGLLHDLGKALIPEYILNKPGKLSPEEFAIMQSHPLKGYNLLKDVLGVPRNALMGMLQHHEKWGGGGYPSGTRGKKINLFARILAVVDIYDAMTSNRVYHQKRAETDVLGFLFKLKDDFAPNYVEKFVKAIGIYPPGTLVRLSDDRLAMVCAKNPDNALRPRLSLVDSDKMTLEPHCLAMDDLENSNKLSIVEVMDQLSNELDISPFQA